MKLLITVICFFVLPIFQTCLIENGWKGIKVFQSNRTDVEKLFGKPTETDITDNYNTEDYLIRVAYSASPCSNDGRGRFNAPKDTVIEYYVVLKKEILLSNFQWKKELYERSEDSHAKKITHYYNRNDEIRITTYNEDGNEKVSQIDFGRNKEAGEKMSCKDL